MPFISIIIPTYNNEEHISQAISSCFDSDFNDFEIIIINDASSDKSVKIIEEHIEKNKKIKKFENPKNLGVGFSRNIGINNAKGEYLLFLDGDDWFEPNAVKTAAKTAAKTKAEVIIFNHQRVWPDQTKSINLPNKYTKLGWQEKNLTEIKDRKDAMKNLHTVWNKLYKTSFIKNNSIFFSSGIYQDFPWSIKALCLAKTVHYSPTILINYRQRRGAITKTKTTEHFDVFQQLDRTLKFITSTPKVANPYKKEIYEYCRLILFGIIKTNYRIPKLDEKLFILECYKEIKKWRKSLNFKNIDTSWLSLRFGSRNIFMLTQSKINHKTQFITSE